MFEGLSTGCLVYIGFVLIIVAFPALLILAGFLLMFFVVLPLRLLLTFVWIGVIGAYSSIFPGDDELDDSDDEAEYEWRVNPYTHRGEYKRKGSRFRMRWP